MAFAKPIRSAILAAAVLASAVAAGCSGYRPAPKAFQEATIQPYRLDSGDRLRVTVFDQASLSNTYSVDQAGYIAFPLIGSVPARGQTIQEMESIIAGKLRQGYLRDPDVSIEVATIARSTSWAKSARPGQYSYVAGHDRAERDRGCRRLLAAGEPGATSTSRARSTARSSPAASRSPIRSWPATPSTCASGCSDAMATRSVRCASSIASAPRSAGSSATCAILRSTKRGTATMSASSATARTGGAYEDALFDEIRPFLSLGILPPADPPLDQLRAISRRCGRAIGKSRSLQPDVLHGHGAKGGAIARLIGSVLRVNRYRVARLYSPHGGSLHYDPLDAGGPGDPPHRAPARILHRRARVRLRFRARTPMSTRSASRAAAANASTTASATGISTPSIPRRMPPISSISACCAT